MLDNGATFVMPPEPNFEMELVADPAVILSVSVPKTWRNRLKYWLFCKFFPFRITRWEE